MHLDHGNSFDLAMKAYRAGYTSIMIDGSHENFEDNIKVTKSVVDACHSAGVPVEAELGKVGGKEDDLEGGDGNPYTVPSEAVEFVNATGVDSLRIAFTKGVRKYLIENPDAIDPKKYNASGREEVKQYVMSKIKVCGSVDKA